MNYDVVAHIAALHSMDCKSLREQWSRYFDYPTKANHKSYLINRIAYRIQELAYGGLSEPHQQLLDSYVQGKDVPPEQQKTISVCVYRQWAPS